MAEGKGSEERHRIAKGITLVLRPESRHWHADIAHGGRRARVSLGTTDRRQAETLAIQEAGKYRTAASEAGTYGFYRALTDWLAFAPRSDREKSMLARLQELYPNRPASEVTNGNLHAALASLSPGYANRIINIARAALRHAAEHDKLPAAPIFKKRPEGPKRQRFLRPEEWIALKAELPPYLLAPVLFSLETGLRRENVLNLMWRNVQLDRATAWVDAIRAKARVSIPVPLSPAAVDLLRAEEGKHEVFVFTREPSPKKRPGEYVPIGDPKKAWWAALERAGLEDFRWHDQRHTWASYHVMKGTDTKVLKELGGWASLEMVERYTHLEPGYLRGFAAAGGGGLAEAAKKAEEKAKRKRA